MKIQIIEESSVKSKALANLANNLGHTITGIANSIEQVRSMVKENRPDLYLYDICNETKPKRITWLPKIINQHPLPLLFAVSNIGLNIEEQDWLVKPNGILPKPFTERSFDAAVKTSIKNYQEDMTTNTGTTSSPISDLLFIKNVDKVYKRLLVKDILWMKGEGNYTRIITANKQHIVRKYLGTVLNSVPSSNFVRVHKSYIVNMKAVEEIRPSSVLINGQLLPVAKSCYKSMMKQVSCYN